MSDWDRHGSQPNFEGMPTHKNMQGVDGGCVQWISEKIIFMGFCVAPSRAFPLLGFYKYPCLMNASNSRLEDPG